MVIYVLCIVCMSCTIGKTLKHYDDGNKVCRTQQRRKNNWLSTSQYSQMSETPHENQKTITHNIKLM